MGKLVGERKQKNFFRVVTVGLLLCCAILLGMRDETLQPESEPSEIIESVTPAPMVSEESVAAISRGVQEVKVKGIYVTGPVAGSGEKMDGLINLVENTKLNAMVIDIKNDSGEVTYNMDYETAKKIGATKNYIPNMENLIAELKQKNIYLIARIVVFKDPILAGKIPKYSVKNRDGTIFRDNKGLAWINPYRKEVWSYVLNIAARAANLGFDEIQFDYIRFPTDAAMKNVSFGEEANTVSKSDIITKFAEYASSILKKRDVKVSADVFGGIISSETDGAIVGQNYARMAEHLDCISPMIYPSQFANGCYGVENPDSTPYDIIYRTLLDSQNKLAENRNIVVRPWLQDFTATWVKPHIQYEEEELRAQIDAVYASGYDEWILWNASNNYTEAGLQ